MANLQREVRNASLGVARLRTPQTQVKDCKADTTSVNKSSEREVAMKKDKEASKAGHEVSAISLTTLNSLILLSSFS